VPKSKQSMAILQLNRNSTFLSAPVCRCQSVALYSPLLRFDRPRSDKIILRSSCQTLGSHFSSARFRMLRGHHPILSLYPFGVYLVMFSAHSPSDSFRSCASDPYDKNRCGGAPSLIILTDFCYSVRTLDLWLALKD
jgi:hypothetical protein